MFIIANRRSSTISILIVIGVVVILSFFLTAGMIFVDDNGIPIQVYAKKQMTISAPFSPTSSLTGNDVIDDQNSTATNNSIINSINDNNSTTLSDITNDEQVPNNNNNNATANSSSYLTYEDHTDGISLEYPSNWQKIEYPSGAMNYGEGHRIIATFLAPLDPSDQWRSSLNIQISNQVDLKNIIPQNTNTTMTNLAGHRAFKLEYARTEIMYLNRNLTSSNSIKLKVMQVWTTIGDNTYLLTYNAEASKYPQYLPTINKMLSSFRIS